MSNDILASLKPTMKPTVMDLVSEAGFDVSDWANCKGGAQKAAANPKYCYEWCFEQEGSLIFNIWFEGIKNENGNFLQVLNLKKHATALTGPQKQRSLRFDAAARYAFENSIRPRVIILDRKSSSSTSANARMLDKAPWTVTEYSYSNGEFELHRGLAKPTVFWGHDEEVESFVEGEMQKRFLRHRHREKKLRQKKIEQNKLIHGGRILCEVPGCGFDFEEFYGSLGEGYAQVHHLMPLSKVCESGVGNTVDDLAVVCANCHAMIHRGGECRDLNDLVQGKLRDV